jgi:catechol 2,3-dioxygenase-like lactoylglutathione lyase family enzyme
MNGTSVDLKLEVVVLPVSDVDRSKRFYEGLGWRVDADFPGVDGFRVVQMTPPGSPCSIHFGKKVTTAAPGSIKNLYLVVSDIEAARRDLAGRGADVSEAFHFAGFGDHPYRAPSPPVAPTELMRRSAIPTATLGSSRRSRRVFPDEGSATSTSRP